MPSAVLLACPTCDSVRALEGSRNEYSKANLCATVKGHLRTHSFDETKAAIQKHQMADEAVELIVAPEYLGQLPTEAWRTRTTTWLPEGVPGAARATEASSESAPGATDPQSHVEESN